MLSWWCPMMIQKEEQKTKMEETEEEQEAYEKKHIGYEKLKEEQKKEMKWI